MVEGELTAAVVLLEALWRREGEISLCLISQME